MNIISSKLKNLKKAQWVKILIFTLLLIFYASLITYQINLTAAEDLSRQMMNGKDILSGNFDVLNKNVYSYTEPNHEFANHHWLYGVFVYVLHSIAGFEGIVIFKVILFLCLFSLLFYVATRKASFHLVALFSIPTILMLSGRGAARPEMFSYIFIVIFLYFLVDLKDNPKSKKVFWLIPLQILWANLHIMFPVGVALVGSFWVENLLINFKEVFKNALVKKLTALLVLITLVSFINPWGIEGVLYSLKANTVNTAYVYSNEVQSISTVFKTDPKSDHKDAVIFLMMLVPLVLSFVVNYKKRPVFYLLMSIAGIILSLKIIRGIPLFALIFLPAVTSNFNTTYEYLKNIVKIRWSQIYILIKYTTPIFFVVIFIYGMFFWRQSTGPFEMFKIGLTPSASEPAMFFKDNGLKGPIFNNIDIGSYLIYYLYPEEKVYVDNRFADAYSTQFLNEEVSKVYVDEARWREVLSKYDFNSIVLYHYDKTKGMANFIYNRAYDPEWRLVYGGRDVLIFVRNNLQNKDIIDKYAFNLNNIEEKVRSLVNAPDFQGQVAGADIFSYLGNTLRARFLYEKIVTKWDYGIVWFVIGRNELMRTNQENADTALALFSLKHAIDIGYKTPVSYSYLALAYYRLGDIENAKEAVKNELNIDSKNEDGLKWLEIFKKDEALKSIKQ